MIEQKCRLCPRECKAERENGQMGFCGMTGKGIRAARAALHFWEEPCISVKGGSGAVFFAGCTLRCVYCQNREIAAGRMGKEISLSRLVDIFFELKEQGAENINLVTPSHYADKIMSAIRMAKESGFDLPFVYNCSGYEKVEILKQLTGLIDIYLTDFKYMSPESALRYSHAKDYPKAAKAALAEMMRQQPQTIYDEHGMMKRGVLVRHLLLPSHCKEAEQVVKYVYDTYKDQAALSLMCQYTPLGGLDNYPELNRRVTKREYEKLLDFAVELGVENGYMQEMESAKVCYIPPFDGEGIKA